MSLKTIRAAEKGNAKTITPNLRLREYFEDNGIEFLGSIDIGTGLITGAGARWRDPKSSSAMVKRFEFKPSKQEFAFAAARALIGGNLKNTAEALNIPRHKLRAAEDGGHYDLETRLAALEFYKKSGVIFVGWRKPETNEYFGVGVRTAL